MCSLINIIEEEIDGKTVTHLMFGFEMYKRVWGIVKTLDKPESEVTQDDIIKCKKASKVQIKNNLEGGRH